MDNRRKSQKMAALDLLAASKGLVTTSPTIKQQALASLHRQDRPVSPVVGLGRKRKTRRRRRTTRRRS